MKGLNKQLFLGAFSNSLHAAHLGGWVISQESEEGGQGTQEPVNTTDLSFQLGSSFSSGTKKELQPLTVRSKAALAAPVGYSHAFVFLSPVVDTLANTSSCPVMVCELGSHWVSPEAEDILSFPPAPAGGE